MPAFPSLSHLSEHSLSARIVLLLALAGVCASASSQAAVYGCRADNCHNIMEVKSDGDVQTEAHRFADLNATKMRAGYQRDINDLMLLFGDKLPVSQVCTQAAVSNYIEDKWNAFAAFDDCASNKVLCDKGPKAEEILAAQLKEMGRDINNKNDRELGVVLANTWHIAARLYGLLNQIHYQLDPADEANSFSDVHHLETPKEAKDMTDGEKKKQMDEFNGYVNSCDKRKPVPWSIVGAPFSDNYMLTAYAVKLGIQEALVEYLIASQLPDSDKGYVGCLHVLNAAKQTQNKCNDKACADVFPTMEKQDLMSQLSELRAHECSSAYAFQMVAKDQ